MFKKWWSGLGVVVAEVALLTLPVAAQDRANGPDQELVTRLHQLSQDEIAMAQLGERQGVSEGVRNFAAALAAEQRASDSGLIAYAQQKNMDRVQVALPGGALEHGVLLRAPIANSPANQFDYRFMSQVVADHQGVIDAATAAQRLARDPQLKSLIGQVLALQSDHLVSAQEILARIPAPQPAALNPVPLPAFPTGVSRTRTGADNPPPAALQPGALNR
jgi:predicted outer membrane protein